MPARFKDGKNGTNNSPPPSHLSSWPHLLDRKTFPLHFCTWILVQQHVLEQVNTFYVGACFFFQATTQISVQPPPPERQKTKKPDSEQGFVFALAKPN